MAKTILIASDHAAYPIKNHLFNWLKTKKIEIIDLGTDSEASVDYTDYGHKLGNLIDENPNYIGIALCGSGNGINMSINKHTKARSALCWNSEISYLARLHNDANVCVIPGRYITQNEAEKIIDVFLNTNFEGGRHFKRVEKIPLK